MNDTGSSSFDLICLHQAHPTQEEGCRPGVIQYYCCLFFGNNYPVPPASYLPPYKQHPTPLQLHPRLLPRIPQFPGILALAVHEEPVFPLWCYVCRQVHEAWPFCYAHYLWALFEPFSFPKHTGSIHPSMHLPHPAPVLTSLSAIHFTCFSHFTCFCFSSWNIKTSSRAVPFNW